MDESTRKRALPLANYQVITYPSIVKFPVIPIILGLAASSQLASSADLSQLDPILSHCLTGANEIVVRNLKEIAGANRSRPFIGCAGGLKAAPTPKNTF